MKKKSISNTDTIDAIAMAFSLLYLQSILTVAHHTSHWMHDGSSKIVEPPFIVALVISLLLIAISIYKNKRMSKIALVTLTILATSSIFWFSGLRTNFYF